MKPEKQKNKEENQASITMLVSHSETKSVGLSNPLSSREQQLLELIAEGLGTKQISKQLYITKHTVETHRKRILKKLSAGNMIKAVAVAFRNKILK